MSPENKLIKIYESLKNERSARDCVYQMIACWMAPHKAHFQNDGVNKDASERISHLYANTALNSGEQFATFLYNTSTNPTVDWFDLQHPDPELNDIDEVKEWYRSVTEDLNEVFMHSEQSAYAAWFSRAEDIPYFGYGTVYSRELPDKPGEFSFECIPAYDSFFQEDADGKVNIFFRRLTMTASQMEDRWGQRIHERTKRALKKGDITDRVQVIHVALPAKLSPIKPTDVSKPKKYVLAYFDLDNRHVLTSSYTDYFPYHVLRWRRSADSPYPTSLAWQALPEVLNENGMRKLHLRAFENNAEPALLAADEDTLADTEVRPGELIYGAIDENGESLIRPLQYGSNPTSILRDVEYVRSNIRESFLNHSLTSGNPAATATEALLRDQVRTESMSPFMVNMSPDIQDMILRVLNLRIEAGLIDEPPEVIKDREDNTGVRVVFKNILSKLQRKSQASALLQIIPMMQSIAQFEPDVLLRVDWAKVSVEIASGYGLNEEFIRTDSEIAKLQQAAQQMQQAQQQLALAQQGADVVKTAVNTAESQARTEERRANVPDGN